MLLPVTTDRAYVAYGGTMKRVTPRLKQEVQPTFIKEWRKEVGLSQDKLVERVREELEGFSKSTLSRLENAKQPYTQPMLEALARALNRSPADLIMRDPNSDIWSIIDTLQGLPPAQRATIVQMIDGLKKAS